MTAATDTTAVERIRRSARRVPVDAILVLGFLPIANLVLGASVGRLPRLLVGLPLLFVLPGYAISTVLFPRRAPPGSGSIATRVADRRGALSPGGRAALSFGTSLSLLAPLGLGLAASGLGLSLGSVFGALSLVVVVGAIGGAVRRARVPDAERFTLPFGAWADAITDASPGRLAVDLVLVVAVVLALSTLGAALFGATTAEAGTQLALLSADETGEPVAADPPEAVVRGQPIPLVVGVTNNEGREHTYTVVAELERVREREGDPTVVQSRELRQFVIPVAANETVREPHTIAPPLAGEDLRLTYHLYIGPAPDDPSRENAYRTVHVWIDVRP